MPNYSSSKSAWPTKNLFIGGGPSRPFNKITITTTKTKQMIGPTRKAVSNVRFNNMVHLYQANTGKKTPKVRKVRRKQYGSLPFQAL